MVVLRLFLLFGGRFLERRLVGVGFSEICSMGGLGFMGGEELLFSYVLVKSLVMVFLEGGCVFFFIIYVFIVVLLVKFCFFFVLWNLIYFIFIFKLWELRDLLVRILLWEVFFKGEEVVFEI